MLLLENAENIHVKKSNKQISPIIQKMHASFLDNHEIDNLKIDIVLEKTRKFFTS